MEGTDLGHAPSAHERAHRLHVPHLLQLPGADLACGDAGAHVLWLGVSFDSMGWLVGWLLLLFFFFFTPLIDQIDHFQIIV